MAEPTAIVRVTCRADTFEETARKLAWTVGHPVQPADVTPRASTRNLLVLTDLAYHGHDDTILERLGMDIIGKVAGVLSWEVVASDQPLEVEGVEIGDFEAQLTEALGALPAPVSLMRRDSGRCVWKWMEVTGEAETFATAVSSVLSRAVASLTAVQGELQNSADKEPEAGVELEAALTDALLSMPAPVGVLRSGDGRYAWRCMDAGGEADTFVAAVSAVFAHAVARYLDARREVMESYPATWDAGWQLND